MPVLWRTRLDLVFLVGRTTSSGVFWGVCDIIMSVCSSFRQDGVKGVAALGALAHSGLGEGGVRMRGEPAVSEAS